MLEKAVLEKALLEKALEKFLVNSSALVVIRICRMNDFHNSASSVIVNVSSIPSFNY